MGGQTNANTLGYRLNYVTPHANGTGSVVLRTAPAAGADLYAFNLGNYPFSLYAASGYMLNGITDGFVQVPSGGFAILISSGTGNYRTNIVNSRGELDLRFVTTSSYGPFTASLNTFSASVNTLTASLKTFSQSINGFTASFTSSVQSIGDARYTQTVNTFSGTIMIVAGPNVTVNSGSGQIVITGSAGSAPTDISALNTFSQSVNTFSASHNTFSSSVNTFSASQLTYNSGINTLTQSLNLFSASHNAFSQSVNTFTASFNIFSSAINTFSASVNTFTASFNIFSGVINGFTSSFSGSVTSIGNARYISGSTGGTDNVLLRADGTGGKMLQSTGITVSDTDAISGHKNLINALTGTAYTILAADTGKHVLLTNAAAIAVTVPNTLLEGFQCTWEQGGAGQITFSGTAIINNRSGHTKSARTTCDWYALM